MTFYIRTPHGRILRPHTMHNLGSRPFADTDVFFPVDVKASEDEFIITALLPGLKAEDLSIQVVNETVSLKGEFKYQPEENANYILQEIPGGKFSRILTLPDLLDAAKAEAEMKDGVLTLRIPKAEESKPKTIKIVAK